jgi:hypothetical protein
MWTLHDFPTAAVEEAHGVAIDDAWLDHVQRSTVRLDGGCTGSFVSEDGLVLTNNHCVWGCVRNLSTDERNLSETGFLAAERGEEIQCPGFRISVLQDTEEVTEQVREATAGKAETQARETREALLSRLEEECEGSGPYGCEAVTLYRGGEVHLYKYRRYDDVRLVFSPELAIAAFGGDPDNFEFPRWCLDMSMLRVYEDGEPAATPDFLRWDADGPDAGQPVFVVGHPGSTQRLQTVAELENLRRDLPQLLLLFSELRGRLVQWAETSDEAARQVQQRILGLENGLKVGRNRLASLLDDEQMTSKRQREAELRRAVAADPDLQAAYGSAWDDALRAVAAERALGDRYRFLEEGWGFQGDLYDTAQTLVRAAAEREKPSDERLRTYRDTALPRLEQQMVAPVPIDPGYETLMLTFSLDKMREWLGPDDPTVRELLGETSPAELAARLVTGTRLTDPEVRRALWEGGSAAVAASDDPMIVLARRLEPTARELRRRYDDQVEAPLERASEQIARARFAVLGNTVYPDATFTLRVSHGSVRGWTEDGETVAPFTDLARLWARATGEDPFRVPASWLEAREELPPSTPFNFVADTDIVGGNSGSPMVDAAGRLVGLVFDGNIHSIAGSYWFDPELNRTVAVHPAILLEALETVYGAGVLVDELTVAPAAAASETTGATREETR